MREKFYPQYGAADEANISNVTHGKCVVRCGTDMKACCLFEDGLTYDE